MGKTAELILVVDTLPSANLDPVQIALAIKIYYIVLSSQRVCSVYVDM